MGTLATKSGQKSLSTLVALDQLGFDEVVFVVAIKPVAQLSLRGNRDAVSASPRHCSRVTLRSRGELLSRA
jgi:hypothetical protein